MPNLQKICIGQSLESCHPFDQISTLKGLKAIRICSSSDAIKIDIKRVYEPFEARILNKLCIYAVPFILKKVMAVDQKGVLVNRNVTCRLECYR